MSKFNKYGKKLNEIAKTAFSNYEKLQATYAEAEAAYNKVPKDGSPASMRAEADFLEAKASYDKARRDFGYDEMKAFKELRAELEAAVNDEFSVKPDQLDANTLELMKSGILTGNEYDRLMNAAQEANNATMVRLIAKYADDAAEQIAQRYGPTDTKAVQLRAVSYKSRGYSGDTYLQTFDELTNAFDRCTHNTAMIGHWDDLTGEAVDQF